MVSSMQYFEGSLPILQYITAVFLNTQLPSDLYDFCCTSMNEVMYTISLSTSCSVMALYRETRIPVDGVSLKKWDDRAARQTSDGSV